ncbi:MAG: GNAT family N-acetyltransferase [Stappiaceae bacterium]
MKFAELPRSNLVLPTAGRPRSKTMRITQIEKNKMALCLRVLEQLPNWFAIRSAREDYARALKRLSLFGCYTDHDYPIGILSLKFHNTWNAEIHVMGVLPAWHRRGIGTLLVEKAEKHAISQGVNLLSVKTISALNSDPYYAKTRQFYNAVGFEEFEELRTLWGVENPCLLMIKQIQLPVCGR